MTSGAAAEAELRMVCVWEAAVISVQDLLHEEPPSVETGFISPTTRQKGIMGHDDLTKQHTKPRLASIYMFAHYCCYSQCFFYIKYLLYRDKPTKDFHFMHHIEILFLSVLAPWASVFWFTLTAHVIPWLFTASKRRLISLK